jgi:hypothetical protein
MAASAYRDLDGGSGAPFDLQLDLLVDAELPDEQRRVLLANMDRHPDAWRRLGLRFLQRQVEKESVRQLMAGGRIVPCEMVGSNERPRHLRFPRWVTSWTMMASAAGLLIAVTSALVTVYLMHATGSAQAVPMVFEGKLPGEAFGLKDAVAVNVPLVKSGAVKQGANLFQSAADSSFPSNSDAQGVARRSWVIQPDGSGNALVIPVNTMQLKVY